MSEKLEENFDHLEYPPRFVLEESCVEPLQDGMTFWCCAGLDKFPEWIPSNVMQFAKLNEKWRCEIHKDKQHQ